ncbi:MAG: LysM domain-containing protein, partial [Planctomycetota bacterium]
DSVIGFNNPRNARKAMQEARRAEMENNLGEDWKVEVALKEMPIWISERATDDGVWRWESMTVNILITPPVGQTLSAEKIVEFDQALRAYFRTKLVKKNPELVVLHIAAQAPAKPTEVQPVTPPVVVVPAGPVQRSYTVQAGDTLADISSAFYGTPIHWRSILAANPGLDPGALRPGQAIVIPVVAPAPAPVPPTDVKPAP